MKWLWCDKHEIGYPELEGCPYCKESTTEEKILIELTKIRRILERKHK